MGEMQNQKHKLKPIWWYVVHRYEYDLTILEGERDKVHHVEKKNNNLAWPSHTLTQYTPPFNVEHHTVM